MGKSFLRGGVILGGLLLPAYTLANDASVESLEQQVKGLEQAVIELKKQLDAVQARNESTVAPRNALDAPATRRDLNGIRADLENYKYDQERQYERTTARTRRGTAIGGTVVSRASWSNPERVASNSNTTADESHSSFEIPAAQINFTGSLYRDYAEGKNLDYRLQFAYARNDPSNNSSSQFNLNDAYLVYSFLPTVTGLEENQITATFGQQQMPFGLEAQVGEELRPVIDSAQFLSGLGVGTRQIGMVIRGDYKPYVDYGFNYRAPLLEYAFGIVNGNGPNKSDNNDQKDYILRLASTLPVDYHSIFRELKAGFSYYKGKDNIVYDVGGIQEIGQGDADRIGFDLYYNHDPFGFTYEWAKGKFDTANGERESVGQYLTLYYTIGEQWVRSIRSQGKYDDWWPTSYQFFIRGDEYDPDRRLDDDKTVIYTAGLNVFFAETTKFQFNLAQHKYGNDDPDSLRATAQFQYGF